MKGQNDTIKLLSGSSIIKKNCQWQYFFFTLDALFWLRQPLLDSLLLAPGVLEFIWVRNWKRTFLGCRTNFILICFPGWSCCIGVCASWWVCHILEFRRQPQLTLILTRFFNIVFISILTFCSPICFMPLSYFPNVEKLRRNTGWSLLDWLIDSNVSVLGRIVGKLSTLSEVKKEGLKSS